MKRRKKERWFVYSELVNGEPIVYNPGAGREMKLPRGARVSNGREWVEVELEGRVVMVLCRLGAGAG
jgi:hypothetical protein